MLHQSSLTELFVLRYHGSTFVADKENSWAVYSVCFSGDYLPLLNSLKHDDIVLDLGANIGCFSILAAKRSRLVYSVEPNPDTFKLLVSNINRNNASNVIPLNVAVAGADGVSFLSGHGLEAHLSSEGTPVRKITLDQVCDAQANAIKMDIEGTEIEALRGGQRTLHRSRVILLESHVNTACVFELLRAHSFRVRTFCASNQSKMRGVMSPDFLFDEFMSGWLGARSRLALAEAKLGRRSTYRTQFSMVFGVKS